ncbi:MAG: hypothetical protein OQK75_04725 [Gammaproteobacteria bacterium]|nr:hypothetical protein [Gammaproteobacteria bacterium]MCW8986957.1 hypothetical protein [Gammaproteobacteria bacterium]
MSGKKLFKIVRIFILSMVLIGVALGSWLTSKRSTEWEQPLWIAIYPINADNRQSSQHYIDDLGIQDFQSIEDFIAEEAREFNLPLQRPFTLKLAPQVKSLPPEPPTSGAIWDIMLWSLKLRYWAYQANTFQGPAPHIRIFVKYFDVKDQQPLAHSFGLQQGMLGVVNAFATKKMTAANAVVITHEILHTLGASDKYDLNSGLPIFPDGYVETARNPLHPQELAEIMAGKIPISKFQADIPRGLHQVIMGQQTAREISWLK